MPLYASGINQAYVDGRTLYRSWSKAPTQTTGAGIWFDLSMSPGNPAAQYYFAAPYTSTVLARSTDGGLDHGPSPGPEYKKYLHKFACQTVLSTAAPLTLEILDYLMYYPGLAMDAGAVGMTNTTVLPRYSNPAGVQMMMVEQNPYIGAAQFQVTYVNESGVSGRVTPVCISNSQTVAGTVATSANATKDSPGRYLPLQSGDSGVSMVQSIEFFNSDVGLLALALVKPLANVQIFETTAPNEYDMIRDFGILPEIKDDAYLNMIALPVGTLSGAQIIGSMTTIWCPV